MQSWEKESCYTLESWTVEIKTQLIPKLHNEDLFWVSGHSYVLLIYILLIILKCSFQSSLRNYENKLTLRVSALTALSPPAPQVSVSVTGRQSMAARTTHRRAPCPSMETPSVHNRADSLSNTFLYMCLWSVCVCMCGGQRTTYGVQFSPAMWILGSNSRHPAWRQVPSPREPSFWGKAYRLCI